jgi:predicted DCC family thiol-disulfide oxidoreductase YuxK
MDHASEGRDLILWDGECGFCRRALAWLLARDHAGRLAAVPFQEAPSPPMTPALADACRRAVHVVRADGTILRGGRACLHLLDVVGHRHARIFARAPMLWGIEVGYAVVARNRRLFSKLLFRAET